MARQIRWMFAFLCALVLFGACGDDASNEEGGGKDMLSTTSGTTTDGSSMQDGMTDGDMASDTTHDTTVMLPCEMPVPMSVDTITQEGVVVTNGLSELLTVELPEDVVSLTIAMVEPTDAVFLGINLLEGPGGERLIEESPPGFTPGGIDSLTSVFPGPFASPNRYATAATGVGGMLAPNNPSVNVSPGMWTYQIAAANEMRQPASARVDVALLVKRAAGTPNCGVLDIHLYFTGANGWTAANAPDDAMIRRPLSGCVAFTVRLVSRWERSRTTMPPHQ